MHHHTTRALAAAALALALGACSDIPTTAPARIGQADAPARTVQASGTTLIPSRIRYRDNGGKPATGRSGSAVLRAFALLGMDGVTQLELEAVPADTTGWWAWGLMDRAQVKALNADGSVQFVRNLNDVNSHRQLLQFNSLTRGQSLRVQANVSFIDPHRTDVVTVTERVKLRPDLVPTFQMAPQVPAGEPIPIHATVTELNGDVGATTACVLWVDGHIRDWGGGLWVDAGDAVNCVFSVVFATGTHQVHVEVRGTVPAEWDVSNNRSQPVQVEALGEPRQFSWYADATALRLRNVYRTQWSWTHPATQSGGEGSWEHGDTWDTEQGHMIGWAEPGFPVGPIELQVSQSTGGRVAHSDAWVMDLGMNSCAWRQDAGTSFYLCNSEWGSGGSTWFTYERLSGTVTYHSNEYIRTWDGVTGEESVYHQNWLSVDDRGPLVGFGDEYAFYVRAAAGGVEITADARVPLFDNEFSWSSSECFDSEDWDGSLWNTCYSSETHEARHYGSAMRNPDW